MTRGRFRLAVAVVGVCALLTTASLQSAPTEAAWTDAERATSSAVTAVGTIPPPTTPATCSPSSVVIVGLQSVTLTWNSSLQGGQRVQITRDANSGTDVQGTTGSVITQTGTAGGMYQYSATYTTAKLLGLINLGDLLGGTYTIRIYNGYAGSQWLSAPRTYSLNVIALGLGSTCTLV